MLHFDLSGKAALVTGASTGLGRHFAKVLSAQGAEVVVAARRTAALDVLVAEIRSARGKATALSLDVTDSSSVSAAIAAAGPIDLLVNNAGVTVVTPALEMTEQDFDAVSYTNAKGVFLVATATARSMQSRGIGGSIINIDFILGPRQCGPLTAFAMSKAVVIQMTKQLALELARYQIRCYAIAPGYLITEMNREYSSHRACWRGCAPAGTQAACGGAAPRVRAARSR